MTGHQLSEGGCASFIPEGSDEPFFDLTSATEKSIAWLVSLSDRSFVGTESRLLTLFELLRQMGEGSEADPQIRITELQKRRDELDTEIARVHIIEPFVSSVGFVQNDDGRTSKVRNLTIEEYRAEKSRSVGASHATEE